MEDGLSKFVRTFKFVELFFNRPGRRWPDPGKALCIDDSIVLGRSLKGGSFSL
jgi:hypothetical protein